MRGGWTNESTRPVLRRIFDAAMASADPGSAVLRYLLEKPEGRCVVGAGQASAAMAAALDIARGDLDLSGVVIDARARLTGHGSYTFFKEVGDLIVTGPTLTNGNDIRAIVIA